MSENDTGVYSDTEDRLVSTGAAAKRLAMTPAAVRKMAERGDLAPTQKLDGRLGAYLFRASDVEALAAKRAEALEKQLEALRSGGVA